MKRSPRCGFISHYFSKQWKQVALLVLPGSFVTFASLSLVERAIAQDPEMIIKLSEAVGKICSIPAETGTYFEVEGKGEVKGRAGIILKFIEGDLSGKITEKEWQGIQDVLEKDRATDRISSRECVREITPLFLKAFGLSPEGQSLLEKETRIQEALYSDNPAGRLVAFREAFKSVQVFFVDLTPENGEQSKSTSIEISYERSISRNVKTYNFENGSFRDDKAQDFYALSGQINEDSITFRNYYCSGHLRHQPGTWSFRGPVTCSKGKFQGVFNLK